MRYCRFQTNVLSLSSTQLRSDDLALGQTRRIGYIQEVFSQQGVHIAGLQETRMPGPTSTTLSKYICFTSTASAGHYGSELWISKDICQLEHFTIQAYQPRFLLAAVRNAKIALNIVVSHASVSSRRQYVCNEFWNEVDVKRRRCRSSNIPCILCADSNARVGSVSSSSVGVFTPMKKIITAQD